MDDSISPFGRRGDANKPLTQNRTTTEAELLLIQTGRRLSTGQRGMKEIQKYIPVNKYSILVFAPRQVLFVILQIFVEF
jgi:hypothetical protein